MPHSRRFSDFSVSLIGGRSHPEGCALAAKAMESRDLLTWAENLLRNVGSAVPGRDELLASSSSMNEFLEVCSRSPYVLNPALQQRLFDLALRSLLMADRAGIKHIPKHHSFLHLAARTA